MEKYQKRLNPEIYASKRSFTRLDFMMSIIAIFVLFIIGLRHLDTYGRINIMEGFFALSGILFIDLIRTERLTLPFRNYKEFKPFPVLLHTTLIFLTVVIIQFVLLRIPFTIDQVEFALSIVFASVAEELFFRGILISLFKKLGKLVQPTSKYSMMGIMGILISGIFFAVIHTNYLGNTAMFLSVLIGGFAFGLFYFIWDDLTANILAHFILNVVAVGQWLVVL